MKNSETPPKLATRFLRWYCHEDLVDEVEGDLYELFQRRIETKGVRQAKALYWLNVLMFLHPDYIRKRKYNPTNPIAMYKSYFKIGWRNLKKQKMYSAINIGGLALGLAACLLIALFIQHELSYDQQYPDSDRIYRVIGAFNDHGEIQRGAHFPAPLARALEDDFPEVEAAGHFLASGLFGAGNKELRRADKTETLYEEGFVFADQGLLDILQPHFISGDPKHILDQPNTIAIAKSKADKYFPGEDPVGKTLILDNNEEKPYKISGVFEDFPSTSHLQAYDFLMSIVGANFYPGEQTNWGANNYYTYIRVQPGTEAEPLAAKFTEGIIKQYLLPTLLETGRADAEEMANSISLQLQSVSDIHLRSVGIQDGLSHSDIRFVWLFGAIAGFILIIACINFVNLSTAKSANRATEVGLRKVVGSRRAQLVKQFLTESVLFSVLAFLLSLLLAQGLLPYFNDLAGKTLSFPWSSWWLVPLIALATLLIGVLAGVYPAFYLSRFKPAQVLKGGLSRGSKSSRMRSLLVIFQFATSIVLIIGTLIIYRQMNFILNKEVGFNKEQVLLIQGANTIGAQLPTFKNELLALSGVENVSLSDYLPIAGTKRNQNPFWKEGKVNEDAAIGGQIWRVDTDYIPTMGMNIVEGRNFKVEMASDSQAVIINQKMAGKLGLVDPVGQRIVNGREGWQVIGVVEDFNFESLKDDIQPLCLVLGRQQSLVLAKVRSDDMSGLLAEVTSLWNQFLPNQAIRYTFLDESFALMYDDVQRMGRIFTSFAALAIIVACLGLFALSAFMVEQRSKEISIRLVLGASFNNVFRLLTQNFLFLILISLLVAVPVAWYLMQQWLKDYEYRIPIRWDVFVLAGVAATVIALLTISFQSIKAALANPVDSLRNE